MENDNYHKIQISKCNDIFEFMEKRNFKFNFEYTWNKIMQEESLSEIIKKTLLGLDGAITNNFNGFLKIVMK